ncbi:DUF805 domain-containing protein [Oceanobacillus salinisoli]|uniref:DUF805 domain-containing protein n=1 Tax=Oceanobacillus salinisoli TaxID=2678611 RepID=UPI0012E242C2|nr:DUF805 domain-containing protein [Oceanobacillus salinisoli]
MNLYLEVIKNYVGFSGRARRKEYWMFALGNIIIGLLFQLFIVFSDAITILYVIFSLFILLPSLAVGVRRLHDIGRSGWWLLIGLVPIIGPIVLLVFMCLDSEEEENKYGPNPKVSYSE